MEKLSRDLMIDILSRLPIKSVLRCKSVSKSWEALLSDPSFAAIQFKNASTLNPFSDYVYIANHVGDRFLYFIEIEDEDNEITAFSKPKHLEFPFVNDCMMNVARPTLMGSCLGYVCFSATYSELLPIPINPMHLFNPIIGASILLPQFSEARCSTCVYGFGLDVSTQKCKAVLVNVYEKTFAVQVHTVGRDYSWRTNIIPTMLTDVTRAELTNRELQTSLPLGFNGSIHWIVLSSVDVYRFHIKRACILSFQLDTEVFQVIPMPEPLQVMEPYFYNSMKYALQVCGGCLSIIYSPEESFVDMWVMADYNISDSWVKKYSIQLNCMRGSELRPFGFRKNGELVLYLEKLGDFGDSMKKQGLAFYNTDHSDRFKIRKSRWAVPFPFVGSLISLKSAYGDSEEPSSD